MPRSAHLLLVMILVGVLAAGIVGWACGEAAEPAVGRIGELFLNLLTMLVVPLLVAAQGIDAGATRFVLPLGSTINMDGSALYEAAAVLFIAQACGIDLGSGAQLLVFITATMAAIGAAGIPEAGLVTMVVVLEAVGLPLEGIGLLLAVARFLDRFRTASNVRSDAVGAAVIDR